MALRNCDEFTDEDFKTFINSFDVVVSDCDDVLWSGANLLPGSLEVMNNFKTLGKMTCFVSNNSTLTRNALLKKLKIGGYQAAIENVLNSSYTTALYIKNLNLPVGAKVYIIGSQGLCSELDTFGIKHIGLGPDVLETDLTSFVCQMKLDSAVAVVVVGFDSHFSVPKLIKASTYLNNPKVHFVATNTDTRSKFKKLVLPGAGTIIRAVKTSSARDPVVTGKPEAFMRQTVLQKWILKPERTLMIGDSSYTDVLFGKLCGFQTLLVLSGVTDLAEVTKWKNEDSPDSKNLVPDFYTNRLGDLKKWFT